jgi:hypothetical protein
MIAMGVFGVGTLVFAGHNIIALVGLRRFLVESVGAVDDLLTGLVVVGMVQFIRYVVEEDSEPRWLLRNGHIILCLLAFSLLLTSGLRSWPQGWNNLALVFACSPEQMVPMDRRLGVAFLEFTAWLPVFTKVLCVLGIAVTLRTVLPIMAESKTLA